MRYTQRVSQDEHPNMRDPDFRVDEYPQAFSEEEPSVYRHETKVRCGCGQVFYLL
jgi:hypothetical protein